MHECAVVMGIGCVGEPGAHRTVDAEVRRQRQMWIRDRCRHTCNAVNHPLQEENAQKKVRASPDSGAADAADTSSEPSVKKKCTGSKKNIDLEDAGLRQPFDASILVPILYVARLARFGLLRPTCGQNVVFGSFCSLLCM